MKTRGILWELFGNLMGNQAPTPFRKIRNILWGHVGATQLALLSCFILRFFLKGQQATRVGTSHVWKFFKKQMA
jgi:hypothetical protein